MLATTAEVNQITGVSVDREALQRAQHIIEMYGNRTEADTTNYSASQLHWLKLAVSYQAAYMDSHPEIFSQSDLESISQGDIRADFKGEQWLAPLARRALRRVGWTGTRSIGVSSDFTRNYYLTDDAGEWQPL